MNNVKSYKNKSCIEASVIMLPTEKASKLYHFDGTLNYSLHGNISIGDGDKEPHHLYFTTDEEIKVGDWCLHLEHNRISQAIQLNMFLGEKLLDGSTHWYEKYDYPKKIVATTDETLTIEHNDIRGIPKSLPRLSSSFIKKYVEMQGIDKVLIEVEGIEWKAKMPIKFMDYIEPGKGLPIIASSEEITKYAIKVAPDNTITTHPIKDSWSREEIEHIAFEAFYQGYRDCETGKYCPSDLKIEFDKWIKNNTI